MTVNQLIQAQKRNNEETEFYPTTQEIVNKIAPKISGSVLDIGCGNGAFFEKLDKAPFKDRTKEHIKYFGKKYGIEKSIILSDELPEDVILIGTDFYQNTLIDKKVDFIWCNPPYSDFETWAEKIILEGNTNKIGMVIPERWRNSDKIRKALFDREFDCDVLGDFDFLDAERKARAKVQLLYIHGRHNTHYDCDVGAKDPFDVWFDNTFKISAEKVKDDYKEKEEKTEQINNELVEAENKADTLVKLYEAEMQEIFQNYKALEELNPEIFKELKVDIPSMKKALKLRLQNLKSVYWNRLFKFYDEMTSRLTSFSIDKITKRLQDNTSIDFTRENIFQLTLWVIKNSNKLYDDQLKHYYSDLIRIENISRYKSNRHWNDDSWRYFKEQVEKEEWHYRRNRFYENIKGVKLEYRIIVEGYSNFDSYWHERLNEKTLAFIRDTCLIGICLGFDVDMDWLPKSYYDSENIDWKDFNITCKNGDVFCNMKLYKNGNRHIKFNKEVIKKMNVEAGRLFGWIRDKEEAEEELGMTKEEINRMWGTNKQLTLESCSNILSIDFKK